MNNHAVPSAEYTVSVIVLYGGYVSGGRVRSHDFAMTHYSKTRSSIRLFWTMYLSLLSYLLSQPPST